jgi:hypothetical protein
MTNYHFLICVPDCMARIYVPIATPVEIARHHIPWPKGKIEQTFACPVCNRATPYKAEDLRSDQLPATVSPDFYTQWAVWKLLLSCGTDRCAGLLEIHSAMPKGSTYADGLSLAETIFALDVPCTKDHHLHTGRSIGESSVRFEIDRDWAVLA